MDYVLLRTCQVTRSLPSDRKDTEFFSFPLKPSGIGNDVTSMEREVAQSPIRI